MEGPIPPRSKLLSYVALKMDNLNLNPPRSRPLSYDALKSVIKSMSVEKRHEISTYLPSLRTINSLLPNTIDNVKIMRQEMKINKIHWTFYEDRHWPNQTAMWIVHRDTGKWSPYFHVNKSRDEAIEKCLNVYLKNGSNIKFLDIDHVPQFLCEREDSDGLKLNISRLQTHNEIFDKFDSFIRFVNLDKLEHIFLALYGSELGMLKMRFTIINSNNLDLTKSASTSPINYYTCLRNQTLVLYDNNFQGNELRMLIENWKTSDRLIGTSFYLYSYKNDTNKMFNSLELQDTFPVEIQRGSTKIRGIGIKMDKNRDLVVYHGQHLIGNIYRPALKMEMIASGSLNKNEDFVDWLIKPYSFCIICFACCFIKYLLF
ncbi:hypothetical protein CRE_17427 [Caenorhabditis remanei]|uniref:F-box associated domain-containing protein n=1 Tax=Caenorhabditis remanei TaxID=31234 RepID=E3N200_CAERE|nr:hypothetical protein CRE_17427 [Caenorhabditis remanei]